VRSERWHNAYRTGIGRNWWCERLGSGTHGKGQCGPSPSASVPGGAGPRNTQLLGALGACARRRRALECQSARARRSTPVRPRISLKIQTKVSNSPKTKLVYWSIGYNFYKGRHGVWANVWPRTPVEVGRTQNAAKLFNFASTMILSIFHSKFEMPLIDRNVFPEITNNFSIGRLLSCYTKIWGIAMPMQRCSRLLGFWPLMQGFE
jgi:hypothetical protein